MVIIIVQKEREKNRSQLAQALGNSGEKNLQYSRGRKKLLAESDLECTAICFGQSGWEGQKGESRGEKITEGEIKVIFWMLHVK